MMSLLISPSLPTSVPLCQFTVESFVSLLSTDESIREQVRLIASNLSRLDRSSKISVSILCTPYNSQQSFCGRVLTNSLADSVQLLSDIRVDANLWGDIRGGGEESLWEKYQLLLELPRSCSLRGEPQHWGCVREDMWSRPGVTILSLTSPV